MILSALGIDIAKLKFNVCLINPNGKLKHTVFVNTEAGFAQLSAWLIKQGVSHTHACMEATGADGEALALFLHAAGHTVSVVNPAAIKAFAGSRLARTKTDKVDAELIARLRCGASTAGVDAARAGSAAVAGACPTLRRALRDAYDGIESA
ncbi:MAG: transposase [Pyrinomonadaceae bacterium]